MTCVETVDGGKLKEAATKEAGDSILIQIGIESEIPQTLILLWKVYTCKRFPQLVFHRAKVRNKSEIVHTECLSQASVAESFMDDDIETSQSSQESESDNDIGTKASTYSTQVQDWKKFIQLRNNLQRVVLDIVSHYLWQWHMIQLLHRQLSTHQHYSSNIWCMWWPVLVPSWCTIMQVVSQC